MRLDGAHVSACGNGGSAATAAHFVNDLNMGAIVPAMPRFRAIWPADSAPLLTAWSNHEISSRTLSEALMNLAELGDCLVAMTYSGTIRNIIEAARSAQSLGMKIIGLTSESGGALRRMEGTLEFARGQVEYETR